MPHVRPIDPDKIQHEAYELVTQLRGASPWYEYNAARKVARKLLAIRNVHRAVMLTAAVFYQLDMGERMSLHYALAQQTAENELESEARIMCEMCQKKRGKLHKPCRTAGCECICNP